jgi:hypothetical protein
VRSYADANGGQLPADLAQLRPFLVFPVPDAMLARYEMRASGLLGAVARDLPMISEKASAIAIASDRPFVLRPSRSSGLESFRESPFLYTINSPPELAVALSKANQAYRVSHDGAYPKSLAELMLYFESPALATEFADIRAAKDTLDAAIDEGMRGYAAANGGRKVTSANRADILPFIRDPAVRGILTAKDAYLRSEGMHPQNSAALRPYVKEPAARALLERIVRAEVQLEGR